MLLIVFFNFLQLFFMVFIVSYIYLIAILILRRYTISILHFFILILLKIPPIFIDTKKRIIKFLKKMSNNREIVPFDIQKKIRKYLSDRRLPVSFLAKDLHISSISLHQQLHRNTMQVDRLWSICKALKWNIFQEIADRLEKEIHGEQTKAKNIENQDVKEEVNQLKKTIELLENENKTLKEVITLLKS